MTKGDPQSDEARRILRDLSRDRGGVLDSALARAGEEPPVDSVEIWAKRIGRALGAIFLALLAVNLATGWFF